MHATAGGARSKQANMAESSSSSHASPFSTPKRKRADMVIENVSSSPSYTPFSFEFDAPVAATAGGSSPRSKVAHRFRGLALSDSGGGVATANAQRSQCSVANPAETMEIDQDESKMRKRTRLSPSPTSSAPTTPPPQQGANARDIPETPAIQANGPNFGAAQPYDPHRFAPIHESARSDQNENVAQIAIDQPLVAHSPVASPAGLSKGQQTSLPSRPAETLKQKNRKKAGTPPLTAQRNKTGNDAQSGDEPSEIVDPIRAALTWHDDEITVYDPNDEDDDGVGINGIGFKPTPAIAYARTMKKRQQLAEYRKREEREARARRSHRRRGSPERPAPKSEPKQSPRKVRFTEAEPSMMIETI